MQGLILKIRAWWNIADKTARTVTIVGVAFLLVTMAVTFYLASKPDFVVLYADLTPADSGKVINKLKDLKVPFRIGADGATIEVPKRQRDEVRMKLAADGLPVQAAGLGKGWLDKSSIGQTQEHERVVMRVMLEEELQKTIESLKPVQAAKVHLTEGQSGPFADQQTAPTANVVVHLGAGEKLAPEQVAGIVHVVTGSVSGMTPRNVSVVDGEGRVLHDGATQGPGGTGIYDVKRQQETAYAAALRSEIERHLEHVLGPGKAIAGVQCVMNFDTEQSERTINTPSAGSVAPAGTPTLPKSSPNVISETTTTETYSSGGTGARGAVGTASNVAGATGGAAATSGAAGRGYSSERRQSEYAFDQEHRSTTRAPGRIEKLSVSVMVDESVKPEQVTAVTQYLNGLLGISDAATPPPGYSVSVNPIAFDKTAKEAAMKAGQANASAARIERYLSLLPSIALILAAILVMKALGKQSIRLEVPQLSPAAAGAGSAPPSLGEPTPGTMPRLQEDTPPQQVETKIEVTPIPTRFNVPFEQIARMVNDNPRTVAMLVKSWLMEDKR
ncbi:MAG: flagellar M-ring protein FliF [Fimbriimonadia bacterium]|jgi:flagellar M-ring protein FliF